MGWDGMGWDGIWMGIGIAIGWDRDRIGFGLDKPPEFCKIASKILLIATRKEADSYIENGRTIAEWVDFGTL